MWGFGSPFFDPGGWISTNKPGTSKGSQSFFRSVSCWRPGRCCATCRTLGIPGGKLGGPFFFKLKKFMEKKTRKNHHPFNKWGGLERNGEMPTKILFFGPATKPYDFLLIDPTKMLQTEETKQKLGSRFLNSRTASDWSKCFEGGPVVVEGHLKAQLWCRFYHNLWYEREISFKSSSNPLHPCLKWCVWLC